MNTDTETLTSTVANTSADTVCPAHPANASPATATAQPATAQPATATEQPATTAHPTTSPSTSPAASPNTAPTAPLKVVLYSHDSQGIGHVRRNLAVAHQLVRDLPRLTGRQVSGLIVSGLSDATAFPLPEGFDWLFIPSITKGSHGYRPRNLAQSMSRTINLRSTILRATLDSFRPDLFIVDRHILGVQQELRAPLLSLKRNKPNAQIVLGMREILDEPSVAAAEWDALDAREDLDHLISAVWLFGDRAVHDPTATGELPDYLCERLHFTGYLAEGREHSEPDTTTSADFPNPPFILTTVGGGGDGFTVLSQALRMRVPAGHRHIVVTGPQLSRIEFARLQRMAGPHTELHRYWPGLSRMISRAVAVISMGGYNTCAEILASTTPALIVPREQPRLEQLIRARSFTDATLSDHCRVSDLTPEFLSEWVEQAVTRRADRSHVARNGLEVMAQYAAELLGCDTENHHHVPATAGAHS